MSFCASLCLFDDLLWDYLNPSSSVKYMYMYNNIFLHHEFTKDWVRASSKVYVLLFFLKTIVNDPLFSFERPPIL